MALPDGFFGPPDDHSPGMRLFFRIIVFCLDNPWPLVLIIVGGVLLFFLRPRS